MILVVDVGTTSVRAAAVTPDATIVHEQRRPLPPTTPFPGLVEVDASELASAVLELAGEVLAVVGPVHAVGVTNQRATTIVWDRATGEPVGPGLGWQDLRTVGTCLELGAEGLRVAPNLSATKASWLLDTYDADRARDLCIGTVDSWVVWQLSGGTAHLTDATNAALTGLTGLHGGGTTEWDPVMLERLRIPAASLPRVVDSTGVVAEASALPGSPPIAGLAGDQQASLVGQGCVRPGMAKATFGTGGMLDVCLGERRPACEVRGGAGCFPIIAWQQDGEHTWGVEAAMLAAGANVEWLVDDLGLVSSAAETAEVASACADTGDVWFVPALLGLGTPHWDHGARGTLLGLTRGTGRAEVVRAVLEGVAHRGADLLEAAEADGERTIASLRVDGGMSANAVFVQALADACGRPVEVSPVVEATTLGAAYLAGMASGVWSGWDDVAATWSPRAVVEPASTPDRDRWREAVSRARSWIPELSAIDF